jgi:hypothetical protein
MTAARVLVGSRTAGSRVLRRLLTLGLGVFLVLSELILWQRAHLAVPPPERCPRVQPPGIISYPDMCKGVPAHPEWFAQANAVLLGTFLVVLAVILGLRWRRRVA